MMRLGISHAALLWWLFFSLARIVGECSTIHSSSNVTIYARISPQWLIGLRRLWPTVPWRVACELVSWYVPTLWLDSGIVSPLLLRWVQGVCVFRCNLPPALFAEWPGSFTCHCGNMGVERTSNKSQHTKLTLEKKILPPLLPGFELATFRSRVRRSTNKLSRLPRYFLFISKK